MQWHNIVSEIVDVMYRIQNYAISLLIVLATDLNIPYANRQ